MKTTVLCIIFTTLAIIKSLAQHEWVIIREGQNGNDTLRPNDKYQLKNVKSNKALGYQEQKKGINLGWFKPQKTKLNIILKDKNGDGILDQRDSVAIYVEGGLYLKYGAREYGINMIWSQAPVYEWVIVTKNQEITNELQNNKLYGFYNLSKQAYLIYAEKRTLALACNGLTIGDGLIEKKIGEA